MSNRNFNLSTGVVYNSTVPNKGTEIFDRLRLLQYENSPNLKEYINAYVAEMDILFEEIEKVYQGRFIENAVGRQLDIIGIILDEPRGINLPTQFFGFSDYNNGGTPIPFPNVAKMADKATPADGGIFRSTGQSAVGNYVLSDTEYRRLLLAKAILSNRKECGVDNAYYVMATLLGRVPRLMEIHVPTPRQLLINFSTEDVSLSDVALISYFGQYLFPLGTSFSIVRV
tara:strand:- start:3491 stop:4174 length:684 start_codon:yes stop_codon:yes gene_type:complete